MQTIHKGGTAQFKIKVINNGTTNLTDVTIEDLGTTNCSNVSIGRPHSRVVDGPTIRPTKILIVSRQMCSRPSLTRSQPKGRSKEPQMYSRQRTLPRSRSINPVLNLTKLTNDDDGDIRLRTGTLVTWEYIVENTGDVDLTDVTVVDVPEGTITCPSSTLAVGASMTCLGYGAAGEVDYTNTATATGTSTIDLQVTAEDDSSYTGFNPGVIGNRIWLDENGNGIPDAGEIGIPNLKVELKVGDTVVATTYTDTNGGYLFTDLLAGNYQVVVTPATGLEPTYNEDLTAEPAGELDNLTVVTLAAGVQHLTADFGYNWVPPADSTNPSATSTGAIGDRVWNDANSDGVQNPGESGIEGVMTLTGPGPDGIFGTSDDVILGTTQTDAAGNYIFNGLLSGTYSITVDTSTLPDGNGLTWTQTGDRMVLARPTARPPRSSSWPPAMSM